MHQDKDSDNYVHTIVSALTLKQLHKQQPLLTTSYTFL